jgi:hypothetical protein
LKAGVPEDIIKAMAARESGVIAPQIAQQGPVLTNEPMPGKLGYSVGSSLASLDTIPKDVGIYILLGGKLLPMQAEVFEERRGGDFTSMWTAGVKPVYLYKVNPNPTSNLRVSGTLQFLIKTPEGTSVADTRLVKFDIKKNHREFRIITVGWDGAKYADRNLIPLTPETLNNHIWRFNLICGKGEYGFIAVPDERRGMPRDPEGKLKALSWIYTFGVD